MNFANAYDALNEGHKIRRKDWEPLMHLKKVDNEVKTYRGEYTNFYADTSVILSTGWQVVDGDGKDLNFVEAIEQLRNKKKLTNAKWSGETFIFIDNDKIAMCKPIEYEFMPSWACLNAIDWVIMK